MNEAVEKNSEYYNLKAVYQSYIEKMEASEHKDSFTRCQIELNMLSNMYKEALNNGMKEEIDYIQHRHAVLSDKFKSFGIILKKITS